MEAVGQLTGGIAHDFNNVLAALMGSLELIKRRADDRDRVAKLSQHEVAALQPASRGARRRGR
jgi:signal transduction histidine kinase